MLSGVIKLSKTLSDGRQQMVALLFPGDFLGRPFRAEFPYTAETATEVQLCCFGRAYFEGFMQERVRPEADLSRAHAGLRSTPLRDWMLLLGRKTRAGESGGAAARRPATHRMRGHVPIASTSRAAHSCCRSHARKWRTISVCALRNRQPPVEATRSDRRGQRGSIRAASRCAISPRSPTPADPDATP